MDPKYAKANMAVLGTRDRQRIAASLLGLLIIALLCVAQVIVSGLPGWPATICLAAAIGIVGTVSTHPHSRLDTVLLGTAGLAVMSENSLALSGGTLLMWLIGLSIPGRRRPNVSSSVLALLVIGGNIAILLLSALNHAYPQMQLAFQVLIVVAFYLASLLGSRLLVRYTADSVKTSANNGAALIKPAVLAAFALVGLLALQAGLPGIVLALLVSIAASALQRTFIDNRTLHRQIAAISRLSREAVSAQSSTEAGERFLSALQELVPFEAAAIWVHSDDDTGFRRAILSPAGAAIGWKPQVDDAFTQRCLRVTRPLIATSHGATLDGVTGQDQSWMVCGLATAGRPTGVVLLQRPAEQPFTPTESTRLSTLSPHLAVCIESARIRRLMAQYQDQAATDGLTGLLNHRRVQEVLREEVRRAERYQRNVSVMMLDVDAFKQFNDRFGHPQGDLLLQSISQIVKHTVRNTDFAGRYGGEEFIVVLPETNRDEAMHLAERIRLGVEGASFSSGHGYRVSKTVSIGVASFPEDSMDADTLVQVADEAMYRAKRSGKNRVKTRIA